MNLTNDLIDDYRHVRCEEVTDHTLLTTLFEEEHHAGLKVIHMNIRSYYKNADEFFILLESISIAFDCVILSEAWLDEYKALTPLDGYDVYGTSVNWNRCDGVVCYVRTGLGAKVTQIVLGEATGLQLDFNINNRHCCLLAIYKSPSMSNHLFITGLTDYYKKIENNTTNILVGDLNIDISEQVNTEEKDTYLDIMSAAGLYACVQKPTRVAAHSSTCIDHIFTNYTDHTAVTSAILHTSLTDHYTIAMKIHFVDNVTITDLTNDSEVSSYVDREVMGGLLRAQSWDYVVSERDVNESCEKFYNTLDQIKTAASRQKRTTTRLKKLKPWITLELIKDIRKRDKLSKILKRQPFNQTLLCHFHEIRNRLKNDLCRVKTQYYRNKLLSSNGNPKVFWNIINEISGVGKNKNQFPIRHFLRQSDTAEGSMKSVANMFNKFFSEVGRKLAEKLPMLVGPPVVDDAVHRAAHEFRLAPVSGDQVRSYVQEMRGGSAPGIDDFPPTTLKLNIDFLILPLTHIINTSINSGVFPHTFKSAKVIPLFKNKSKSDVNNYRPISLLNVASKLLEKSVKVQLQNYLENNSILSDSQFGFRQGKSSSDALFSLTRNLMSAVNNNKKSIVIFIDLAKAFDSVHRNILFNKLQCIGIVGKTLDWFKSYLNNRSQIVSISGQLSEALSVDYGVVQGSNLGPLLFLIYINNLTKLEVGGKMLLFADDTALIFEGNTWEDVFSGASRGLAIVKHWFDQNILTMNVNKTKFMPIALRRGSEPPADLRLILHSCAGVAGPDCGCQEIERVYHYKYLGVIFDSKLRWENHIINLKSRLRKMIHVFLKLQNIINKVEFKILYCAFVQSILQYGIISYGGAFKTLLDPLCVIQKSIIKVGTRKHRRYPTTQLFQESGILTIRQLYIKNLLIFIFTRKELFITPIMHNYQTRNAINLNLQMPALVKIINSTDAYFIANFLYRNIPPEIRDPHISVNRYKQLITAWLLETGPERAEALITSTYAAAR